MTLMCDSILDFLLTLDCTISHPFRQCEVRLICRPLFLSRLYEVLTFLPTTDFEILGFFVSVLRLARLKLEGKFGYPSVNFPKFVVSLPTVTGLVRCDGKEKERRRKELRGTTTRVKERGRKRRT